MSAVGPSLIRPRFMVNPWLSLLVLNLGFALILLDTTVVNVAVPEMEKGLNGSFDQVLWVINGYLIAYAVLLVLGGRVGDMIGPRRTFIAGIGVFTIASLLCAVSQTVDQLIAFRCLQGAAAAFLTPQTLALIPFIFPPEKRGVAQGAWASSSGVALALGPVLGGFLVTYFDWRAIFYINIPLGLAAIVGAALVVPETHSGRRHKIDVIGMILLAASVGLGLYALIEGQRYNWGPIESTFAFSLSATRWSLVSIYSLLVYAVILLAAFLLYEGRPAEPVIPIKLFHIRNMWAGNALIFMVLFIMLGASLSLSIFWQSVLGYSAIDAGLASLPTAIPVAGLAVFAGKLTDRGHAKFLVVVGFACIGLGFAAIAPIVTLGDTLWTFALPLTAVGTGLGLLFPPTVALTMRSVPPTMVGAASGIFFTMRQLGSAAGAAVLGAILADLVAANLAGQAAQVVSAVPAGMRAQFLAHWREASHSPQQFGSGQANFRTTHAVSPAIAEQLARLSHEVFARAFIVGLQPVLVVVALVALAGAAIGLFMSDTPAGTQLPAQASPAVAPAVVP